MVKHIFGQSLYQFIILLILIFNGDNFLPEYSDKLDQHLLNHNLSMSIKYNGDYVRSGRYIFINDPETNDYQGLENVSSFLIGF